MQRDPPVLATMGVYGIRFNTSSLPSSSLDRWSVLYRCCTAALRDARPGCVIVPRIADARLARYGVHERIQSTGFTRFEIPRRERQNFRSSETTSVFEKRRKKGEEIWIISVETFRRSSRNIERI